MFSDALDGMGLLKDVLGINSCSKRPSFCNVRKFIYTDKKDRAWLFRGCSTDKSHRTPVPDQPTMTWDCEMYLLFFIVCRQDKYNRKEPVLHAISAFEPAPCLWVFDDWLEHEMEWFVPDRAFEIYKSLLLFFFWVLRNLNKSLYWWRNKEREFVLLVATQQHAHRQNHSHFESWWEDLHSARLRGIPLLCQS